MDYVPQGDTEEIDIPKPKGKKEKKEKESVKDAIIDKINAYKSKKRKVKRANNTIKRNLDNAKKLQKKIKTLKSDTAKARVLSDILTQNRKSIKALIRDYKNGLITKEKYERNRKIFDKALETEAKKRKKK